MPKRAPGEEIFDDDGQSIRLVADFGFLCSVNSLGRDVALVFTDLANGLTPPEDVRNVLVSAAVDVPESDRVEYIEALITRYGLQECAIMARVMLSHAMIGDVKKSAIDRAEVVRGILEAALPSQSTSFIKAGSLWAGTVAASTLAVCLIFSYAGLHTF